MSFGEMEDSILEICIFSKIKSKASGGDYKLRMQCLTMLSYLPKLVAQVPPYLIKIHLLQQKSYWISKAKNIICIQIANLHHLQLGQRKKKEREIKNKDAGRLIG